MLFMTKNIYMLIAAVFIAGVAFFVGLKYQEAKVTRQFMFQNGFARGNEKMMNRNNNGNFNNDNNSPRGMGFRPEIGKILSIDSNSITIQMTDGSSRIILVGDTTKITKTQDTTKTDLKTGDTVGVFGTINQDGSITAQSIQLNPSFGNFGLRNPNSVQSITPQKGAQQ